MAKGTQNQKIDLNWKPRAWQRLLLSNLPKRRYSVTILHRRAGKTFCFLKYLQLMALSFDKKDPLTGEPLKNPQFAFVASTQTAARRIVWNTYIKTPEFFGRIPNVQFSEKYLTCTFPLPNRGNCTVMLLGAEGLEDIRGNYFDNVVVDEAVLLKRGILDTVIFPALEDRAGSIGIIGTPKGKANELYRYWKLAGENPDEWYRVKLTAKDTGIFSEQQLKKIKRNIGDEAFEQEFMCSFDVVPSSKIYEKQLSEIENQINNNVTYDASHPVHVAMDLGMSDATTILWFQVIGNRINVLESFSDQGQGLEYYVKEINSRRYSLGRVYVPHDINVRELGSDTTRLEFLENFGLRDIFVVPKTKSVVEDIHVCRTAITRCHFHEDDNHDLLDALNAYKRKYDDKLRKFGDAPLHDWSSHYADGFRTMIIGVKMDLDSGGYSNQAGYGDHLPEFSEGFDPFG